MPLKCYCKHDQPFICLPFFAGEQMGAYFCQNYLECGFYLNFDPFEFPNGIAYREYPKKEKKQIPLVTSKY